MMNFGWDEQATDFAISSLCLTLLRSHAHQWVSSDEHFIRSLIDINIVSSWQGLDAEVALNRTRALDCSEVAYRCCTSDSFYYYQFAHLDVQITLAMEDLHMSLLH